MIRHAFRHVLRHACLLVAAALTGCAAMNNLTSDVSSYSAWPADRKPGTYAFERLPSQQLRADRSQAIEDGARFLGGLLALAKSSGKSIDDVAAAKEKEIMTL